MTLEDDIKHEFGNTAYPGADNITHCPCDECTEIATYFRGRSWQGHSTQDLRLHETALCHCTPEAYRYFLPAFLLASLNDYDNAEAITDLIVFSLRPSEDNRRPCLASERIEHLSPGQRRVVAQFLRHLREIQECSDEEIDKQLAALDHE